ncbi:MAG: hypothetical protein FJZ00_00430 [Candidatus Sericytochromatia bacterium]|uniref:Uncharacterized protein n=1 Tax=Candidatus Tanganyikabacteria bacterium TaxID=2961651 RepID=A0A937X4R7_9BACT|nr:hypothetical protein [Candidatus Tanganyikabacteria bacterium]
MTNTQEVVGRQIDRDTTEADTKGCEGDTVQGPQRFVCPVNREPCEVVALFSERVGAGVDLRVIAGDLPCVCCRQAEALAGLKLGKLDRRVLRLAPDGEAEPIPPVESTRAADEAHRRSIRKLERAGLVAVTWKQTKAKRRATWYEYEVRQARHAVKLTGLGAAVVNRLGSILDGSAPIRWAQHQGAITSAVRLPAEDLLPLLAVRAKSHLSDATFAASWGMAGYLAVARSLGAIVKAIEEVRHGS